MLPETVAPIPLHAAQPSGGSANPNQGNGEHDTDRSTRYAVLAIEALRGAGLRITRPRRSIVEVLERADHPLTAAGVHDLLRRKRIHIDLASVYRTLAVLEEQRLIHRLRSVDGVVRCEPGFEESSCHHHLVCRSCGAVKEVGCNVSHALESVAREAADFVPDAHHVELVGLCAKCRATRQAPDA